MGESPKYYLPPVTPIDTTLVNGISSYIGSLLGQIPSNTKVRKVLKFIGKKGLAGSIATETVEIIFNEKQFGTAEIVTSGASVVVVGLAAGAISVGVLKAVAASGIELCFDLVYGK
jgi:hypothetical protein